MPEIVGTFDKCNSYSFSFYTRTQKKQLEEIFKLLETDKDKYGVTTMDDLQAQMKLYTR